MKKKRALGKNVLIIDDNQIDVEFISIVLSKEGYNIQTAQTGKEGVAEAAKSRPDLILLDMIMSDLPGNEVCKQIKDNPDTTTIPVIFISASQETEDKKLAYDSGGLDYIMKPLNKEELLLKINSHIYLNESREILSEQNKLLAEEIRKRLSTEKQLERIYNLLKKTAKIARVGGWVIDTESKKQIWTEELFSIFEIPPDFDLCFENVLGFFEKNAREIFKNEVNNTIKKGTYFNLELPIVSGKGTRRWIHIVGEPEIVKSSGKVKKISGIIQEITRLKETQEALLHGKEREAEYLQIAGVMIAALDENYTISLINNKTCSLLGLTYTEIIGLNIVDSFIPREKQDSFKHALDQVKKGNYNPEKSFDCPLLNKKGTQRLISFTFTPIKNSSGAVSEILLAGEDITEKNGLQEQLIQSERLGAVGQLAAGVAHEFNNILAIIKSIVQLIIMQEKMGITGIDESVLPELKKIDNQTKRGAEIVSNLMTLSKPISMGKDFYYIHDIINDVLKLQHKQCELEHIELITDYRDKKKIFIDRGQFQQVFLNLTLNARHAIRPKGSGSISITVEDRDKDVLVTFSDTGCGMDEDTKSKIFLPFFTTKRAELENGAREGGVKGTGLGLAVSYSIIKNHGAAIGVKSKVGEGTEFTITIPNAHEAKKVKKRKNKEDKRQRWTKNVKDTSILIIDDEKDITGLLSKIINSLGFSNTERAHTYTQIREKLEQKKYDLVFLDFLLSDTDGLEVYEMIRNYSKKSTVVFMTGQYDTYFEKAISKLKIAGYIKKPFEIDEIIGFLKKIDI